MGKSFKKVSARESELMRTWSSEGMGPKAIGLRLRRSTDTVYKHVFVKPKNARLGRKQPKLGRPVSIPKEMWPKIQKCYVDMIQKAKSCTEVTASMIKRRLRLKCSVKTLSREFASHCVKFRPLYSKPTLLGSDVDERKDFEIEYGCKTKQQWQRGSNGCPHAIIDNKVFQVYLNGRFRDLGARRRVRGAYRGRNANYMSGYTKPPKSLKQNTGAKSVQVTCAVGAGRVLMWHVVPERWNADAAVHMYTKPLLTALKKQYPTVRRFRVMEDNDPTGYKCNAAKAAKIDAKIDVVKMPPRSPDLNPLDYSVWAEINRRMRKQEQSWPMSKKESRKAFLGRLRRTAMKLPTEYIDKTIGNLERRCQLLKEAKGGHFAEGGQ